MGISPAELGQGGPTNMRSQFIETNSRRIAKAECPWAAIIAKVDGGYMAFESTVDYRTWRGHK